MLFVPQVTLQEFDKSVVDFVGPINPPSKWESVRYIIIATNYLTKWAKATLVRYCTIATTTIFLFDHVTTKFECQKIQISDHGTHFVNQLIGKLDKKFQIQDWKTMPYHPQENDAI